jgi:hypothetical protein
MIHFSLFFQCIFEPILSACEGPKGLKRLKRGV